VRRMLKRNKEIYVMHYAKDECTPKVEVSPKEKKTNSIVYLFKLKNIVGNEQIKK
jgi:hypothetical protein